MYYFDFNGKQKYPNDDLNKLNKVNREVKGLILFSLGFCSLSCSFRETPRLYFVPVGSRGLIVIMLLFKSTISSMVPCDFPLRGIACSFFRKKTRKGFISHHVWRKNVLSL